MSCLAVGVLPHREGAVDSGDGDEVGVDSYDLNAIRHEAQRRSGIGTNSGIVAPVRGLGQVVRPTRSFCGNLMISPDPRGLSFSRRGEADRNQVDGVSRSRLGSRKPGEKPACVEEV